MTESDKYKNASPRDLERLDSLKKQVASLQSKLAALHQDKDKPAHAELNAGSDEPTELLWTFDLNLRRFTYVNPRVEKLFGMRVGQALTAGPDQTSNPPTYNKIVDTFATLYPINADTTKPRQGLKNKELHIFVRNLATGGSQVANYVIVAQKVSPEGKVVELGGLFTQDPLDEKSEDDQQFALRSWEMLFASLPIPLFVLGIDMHVRFANRAMLQLLDLQENECVGKQCYRLIHDADVPPDSCPMVESMEKNMSVRTMMTLPKQNKQCLFNVAPVKGNDGYPSCAICMACDISSITKNQVVLREELLRLSLAQETGSFGVWSFAVERDNKVTDFTPVKFTKEFYKLLNIDRKRETSFRPVLSFWQRVMSKDDYRGLCDDLQQLIDGKTMRIERSFKQISPRRVKGERPRFQVRALCRYSSEGYPSQVVGVLLDISKRQQLKDRIVQAQALLDVCYENLNGGTFSIDVQLGKPLLATDAIQLSAGARRLLNIGEDQPTSLGTLVQALAPSDRQILVANLIDLALGALKEIRMECKQHAAKGEQSQILSVTAQLKANQESIPEMLSSNNTAAVTVEGVICLEKEH